jgi:tRNA (guanine37-N1)-methyltransferase
MRRETNRRKLYVMLVHHPVLNRRGERVMTSTTTLDVHDIARVAATYGFEGYYVVTPCEVTQALVRDLILHWSVGHGAEYNADRKLALGLVRLARSVDEALERIGSDCGIPPVAVATSAREGSGSAEKSLGYGPMREIVHSSGAPVVFVFGTGWGLAPEVFDKVNCCLEPIRGSQKDGYNHLSVRSAASIIIDRIMGPEI